MQRGFSLSMQEASLCFTSAFSFKYAGTSRLYVMNFCLILISLYLFVISTGNPLMLIQESGLLISQALGALLVFFFPLNITI